MLRPASILLLAALLVSILGPSASAGEDATRGPGRARAVADVRRALRSKDPRLVAHAVYHAGRLGLWKLQDPLIARLHRLLCRPEVADPSVGGGGLHPCPWPSAGSRWLR